MEEVIIATGNPHKVQELRAIFASHGVPVIGLGDLSPARFLEPDEHDSTFEENARTKALSYAQQTDRLCIADDSGLEVDALGGAPGVISSHYATGGIETGLSRAQRDEANNRRLLHELEDVPPERRVARFVCVMCLASPGPDRLNPRILATTRGTFEGRIGVPGDVPRGRHGFGYDPLFVIEDGRTSAELSPDEKNARSHRGAAAKAMAREIVRMFSPHIND
jgi:XTP/dITP diphosphohydrolase